MRLNKKNKIFNILKRLNLSNDRSIELFHNKTRDNKKLKVLRCKKSGVLFLSSTDHLESHYEKKIDYGWLANKSRSSSMKKYSEDDTRRKKQIIKYVKNKSWLDIGTGTGGILNLLEKDAAKVTAVEPITFARENLIKQGYNSFKSIYEIDKSEKFDFVTLFHVYEHMDNPINDLKAVYSRLKKGGKIFIEVPHAQDFLIHFLNLKEFKDFTFWSEHLILHTKKSLTKFIKAAGFDIISVDGFQRYSMKNHLYWIKEKKPQGDKYLKDLNTNKVNQNYVDFLIKNNMTDTIICVAKK